MINKQRKVMIIDMIRVMKVTSQLQSFDEVRKCKTLCNT
jgi:hypothetical protein